MNDRILEPSLHLLARALRLVGELRERARPPDEQRCHLVAGLAALVGAKIGIALELRGAESGHPTLHDPRSFGWERPEHESLFMGYLADQSRLPDPTLPALATVREPLWVRTRQELADDRTWYGSPHYQELRREAGMDHNVLGAVHAGRRAFAFSLHREVGDVPFTERDARLVEVLLHEAAPLVVPPEPLPPRQAAVLDGLCRGLSEKQIAAELGMSPHTVHDHVKRLHLRFGVQSRGELIARALRR